MQGGQALFLVVMEGSPTGGGDPHVGEAGVTGRGDQGEVKIPSGWQGTGVLDPGGGATGPLPADCQGQSTPLENRKMEA